MNKRFALKTIYSIYRKTDKTTCFKIRNLKKTYKMFLLSMNIIPTFSVLSTNCYGTKNVERPRYIIPLRISIQSTIRCLYRTRDIIKNLTGRKRNFYIILFIMKIITCQFLCKPTSRTKRKYSMEYYFS